MANLLFEVGIEKKSQDEKDKKKAKYKNKTKGGNKDYASVADNGDLTINVAKNTAIDLEFELQDGDWDNYHFENNPTDGKVSFTSSVISADSPGEFSIKAPAAGTSSRTMTVTDLNNDGQQWSYTVTLYLNAGIAPGSGNPAVLPLDPIIKNKN